MKRSAVKRAMKPISLVCTAMLLNYAAKAQHPAILLDDFNRSNNVTVGIPAGNNASAWLETETAGSNDHRIRIESNRLVMSSHNNASVGSSGLEQASYDVSNRYATTYEQASTELTWAFNFRQSRSGTSGFGATTYGIAYVLGSSKPTFTDSDAVGYAVIIGNANSPDPVKLVRFKNGLTANSNLTNIVASAEITETAYYSVKVSYDPCTKNWHLQVRNDNGTFADPLIINAAITSAQDNFYTNQSLPFTGAAYNHGTVSVTAFFDNIYIPTATALTSIPYTWTGTTSNNFADPANWSPRRDCVRPIDLLKFNSGGKINLQQVSTQEIGQLHIRNNTEVSLTGTSGGTQTLHLLGSTGEDLLIESNSSLILDSNEPLEISLKSGATAAVTGTMVLQNSVANLGRAHRLLAADANAVVFENGSQFIARRVSGEPFGNNGTANVVVFKNNATYISQDGAGPFGLTSPNSKVIFETGSLYKHEQPGTAPKFDGRIYGNFELNVPQNIAIVWGTSATNPTRIDHFTIISGHMNVTLANGNTALPLQIKGNLMVAPGASFNFTPTSVANTSLISLNGTSQQLISGNINLGAFAHLEINNPAGVTLQSPLTINGTLIFTNGKLNLTPEASLTFADNALASGASNLSYVSGKVMKTGNDAFTFPVGKNGFYAPVAISAPTQMTDQYAAEYFQNNPKTIFGAALTDSLVHISDAEYWDLNRVTGTSEVKVTLSYDPARSAYVANPNDLRIAHFKNRNSWVNEGLAVSGTASNLSLYATRQAQTSFSPFTFGAISGNTPLPVELRYFSASFISSEAKLLWETASEINNDRFEIERSSNGIDFVKIGQVTGSGNSSTLKHYAFTDKKPETGLHYYRLKQIDFDGKATYSKIVSVKTTGRQPTVILYPNPARHILNVSLPEEQEFGTIQILNMLGQPVKILDKPGNQSKFQLNLSDLPAGTYLLKTNPNISAQKFIKLQ